jgi:hypothetical protein
LRCTSTMTRNAFASVGGEICVFEGRMEDAAFLNDHVWTVCSFG